MRSLAGASGSCGSALDAAATRTRRASEVARARRAATLTRRASEVVRTGRSSTSGLRADVTGTSASATSVGGTPLGLRPRSVPPTPVSSLTELPVHSIFTYLLALYCNKGGGKCLTYVGTEGRSLPNHGN